MFSDQFTRRRRFERQIYHIRWVAFPIALAFIFILHASLLWLSLLALLGCLLHNVARRILIIRASLLWLQWGGGLLLFADIGVILLGLWPIVNGGVWILQVVLAALLFETARRLSFETPRISAAGIVITTFGLSGYSLAIAFGGETWQSIVVSIGILLVVGSTTIFTARWRWYVYTRLDIIASRSCSSITRGNATGDNPFTERERQVLALVALGMSNKQVAMALFIAERTVRGHLEHAYRKLDAHEVAPLWWTG